MPMSDEQVQALMQNWRDALAKNMDEMRMRQWCVERAIQTVEAACKNLRPDDDDKVQINIDVVSLSKSLLEFVTAPFSNTFKE